MRTWKLVILLAGMAGVIGFFTPLIDTRSSDGRITRDASAFQIARGVDGAGDVRAQAQELGLSHADSERIARAFHAGIEAYAASIVACFVPAGLLAVLGLLLMLRDRMGRLSGLCAIVLGGASIAVFARFWQADQVSHDASSSLGLGVYLLLAAGLGGALAGLGALVSPDRGS
ncbi:MAG TPA: hypothetical protein VHW23_27515 [Kofleriaceae bacterium]|jgi:hypothetical protein|nr:hypothetical protein [Kofleriaceae bacterium]